MSREQFLERYKDDEDMESLVLWLVKQNEVTSVDEIKQTLSERRFGIEIRNYDKTIQAKISEMINQGKLEVTQNLRLKLPKSQPEQG